MKMLQVVKSISILFLLSVLMSCGSSNNDTFPADSGQVSILISDGSTVDFDQVNLTLESIRLIGDDDEGDEEGDDHEEDYDEDSRDEVILLEESRAINLLALQNYSNLLSTTSVPVGRYSKIRLQVSQVELIKLNSDGTVFSSVLAKLPANGKIDLQPKGSFDVYAGAHLMVELDVDANKSIHIIETGNGKYNFRPVIFVSILGEDDKTSGTITAINDDDLGFNDDSEITITVVNEFFSGDVCVDVELADMFLLGIFGESITSNEIGINDLRVGMSVDVYGEYDAQSCIAAGVLFAYEPLGF